ncbi:pseudouridine-5'-phosphate glycosidase [Actinopolyspora xinjiangensis]|uniref:Pseudouridine-5'-phosphate glycosidase n=1 Tax=Actinopolyspora xinjiangensis TaxID=405564 RepID=A0A1H0WX39_9ACTN|nr:pseudouridine-5'-phosphate glycosidase [Actinopolyspora xinjiangensis]SDP95273.1 pseudouridine-5'-phosphate glycosidase [Actinopolyspora xinjiangensis]
MNELLSISDEVSQALAEQRPVVALESTVIAHGMPYPNNVETAFAIEKAVRDSGAVPATIAIMDGRFVVGLEEKDVERLGTSTGVPKVSSRDIGAVMAGNGLGATTVASTLVAADMAGIPVFSTAGIGGVHRGASTTFDISADLVQFTRSKVAVVCAGAKSVLDLGLTLEYLETVGVPVLGYRCDDFPAFYCRSSGFRNPQRLDDMDLVARAVDMHWQTGLPGGPLVTSPIPEEDALDSEMMESVITRALEEADSEGITGAAITPYLMKAVSKATEGKSSQANRAVLISTADVAGQLAVSYSNQRSERR